MLEKVFSLIKKLTHINLTNEINNMHLFASLFLKKPFNSLYLGIKNGFLNILNNKKIERSFKTNLKKCFLVSTLINQFLLHTNTISHLNNKNVITIRPLS